MKIASYTLQHQRSYGIVTQEGIIDLGSRLGERYPDLKSLLRAGQLSLAKDYSTCSPDFSPQQVCYLPVIESPDKILCVGMNYADKRREFEQTDPAPTLFIRFPDSQTGHQRNLLKPCESVEFDYEGELAVIIGLEGSHIPREQALQHIAGYSCYMDGSARDWQHSWFTAGKNWRRSGGFGPWLTTRDEVSDPHQLMLRTWLNGELVQQDSTANMVHKIPELIEYISTFTHLSAGDVIITGSPGGVGKKRHPPLFLQAGDCIEVGIEQVGHLTNRIADEQPPRPESITAGSR
ncbi:fumarylacetoacetate hydrolase family protein [Tatumella saanichensis]|uniref:fumarylacetoacetate hydrolase family protein n=1 Tax=Tatumella saanichensis TaxID=480813 RepID=UPI0004A34B6E|nr:fumarylacetoacetate hydrolase family protein [Tatumella saanichensis]